MGVPAGAKRKHILAAGALLTMGLLAFPAYSADELTARIWPSQAGLTNSPERGECLFLRAGAVDQWGQACPGDGSLALRPSFGVAFSGGGTRSAAATLGELRALHLLGLDRRLQFISAVSGGSWTAVPYTFLSSDGAIDDDTFLGRYTPPSQITDASLKAMGGSQMGSAIANSKLADTYLEAQWQFLLGEKFAHTLNEAFLRPFGLGDERRLFTLDEASRRRILERNPGLLGEVDFRLVHPERPFLIVGGALAPLDSGAGKDFYPFDITPLYVGAPALEPAVPAAFGKSAHIGGGYVEPFAYDSCLRGHLTAAFGNNVHIGGGYIEPFAYDSCLRGRLTAGDGSPLAEVTLASWKHVDWRAHRFALSDMIATSGAAPVKILARFPFWVQAAAGFSVYEHWPVGDAGEAAHALKHGDGGLVDNLGLMPLLARGVRNILLLVNTRDAVDLTPTGGEPTTPESLNTDISRLFLAPEEIRAEGWKADEEPDARVLEGGHDALAAMLKDFGTARESGGPLFHCAPAMVRPNTRFQVLTIYTPTICWLYLERAEAWLNALPGTRTPDLENLKARKFPFDRFPHYATFFENQQIQRAFEELRGWVANPFGAVALPGTGTPDLGAPDVGTLPFDLFPHYAAFIENQPAFAALRGWVAEPFGAAALPGTGTPDLAAPKVGTFPFDLFPHYATFIENQPAFEALQGWVANPFGAVGLILELHRRLEETIDIKNARVIALRPEQVGALADFAAWSLCTSLPRLRSAMPEVLEDLDSSCPKG